MPNADPPQLDYETPPAPRSTAGQTIAGFLIATALLAGAIFVGIFGSYGYSRFSRLPMFLILTTTFAVVTINLWAYLTYRNPARRAFAQGLWVGFAVTALLEGLCFSTMRA